MRAWIYHWNLYSLQAANYCRNSRFVVKKDAAVVNENAAELFVSIFRHLKLELLTQFPASKDKKYFYFWKADISNIELFD